MASHSKHLPSPAEPYAATTIRDLSDDLLREILLRLPSLPSLVRAAVTCRAFLAAVGSSPAFRRRFRALHPPPLLGIFDDHFGDEAPTFKPIRRRSDPDLAAAVRGLDVLTRVPHQGDIFHSAVFRYGGEPEEEFFPEWQMMHCFGRRLLLLNGKTKQLAAYSPLTGDLDLVPRVADEISKGHFFIDATEYFLVAPDDEASDRLSFHVVSFCFCRDKKSQVRFAVSEPLLSPLTELESGDLFHRGIQVNGFVCWSHISEASMVLLDTATLQFSIIDLPHGLSGQPDLYMPGNTKDGKLCIVSALDFTLSLWFRTSDADGVDKWMLQNVIQLEGELLGATKGSRNELKKVKVFAVLVCIVYLTTYGTFKDNNTDCSHWYLSFCLETRKLEKIFYENIDGHVHPYFMSWPSSLVGMEHRAEGESEELGNADDREIIMTLGAIKRSEKAV